MKSITLRQPHASLVGVGAQTIITTSWRAPASVIGERLLIHAALTMPVAPGAYDPGHRPMVGEWKITKLVEPGGVEWCMERHLAEWPQGVIQRVPLPLGALVASCRLAACVPIVDDGMARNVLDRRITPEYASAAVRIDGPKPTDDEGREIPQRWDEREIITNVTDQLPFGDFTPGRWALLVEDAKLTSDRCPRCWGAGVFSAPWPDGTPADAWCSTCDGNQVCAPIPMKGHPRLWEVDWEAA